MGVEKRATFHLSKKKKRMSLEDSCCSLGVSSLPLGPGLVVFCIELCLQPACFLHVPVILFFCADWRCHLRPPLRADLTRFGVLALPVCLDPPLSFEFSLCLSRACLGINSILYINGAKKTVF